MNDEWRKFMPALMMLSSLVMICLREYRVIDWPLWMVTLPLWIGVAIAIFAAVVLVLAFIFGNTLHNLSRKNERED